MSNAASNAARLARLAGVPCPPTKEDFAFVVWNDGLSWGHIDVVHQKVTRWDDGFQQHKQIYPPTYDDFLRWAEGQGYEFPCTANAFYARAALFAQGDLKLLDNLCKQGIPS